MSLATSDYLTLSSSTSRLSNILHNSLILTHVVPYLTASSVLSLASTSKELRAIVQHTPGVFRHLDLSTIKAAQFDIDPIDHGGEVWRNVQLDENVTEDDFYSGPLRGVFSTLARRHILQNVQTLVLDGLSVTSDLCYDIINDPLYSVRILSLRQVKNLNQGKLRSGLQYACRPGRAEGAPRLKGVYVFTSKDNFNPSSRAAHTQSTISAGWNHKSQRALTSSLQQEKDSWWSSHGKVFPRALPDEWANTMQACDGLIAFDAVLCQGPRHSHSPVYGKYPMRASNNAAIAIYTLPSCEGCGKAPEGVTYADSKAATALPLLTPIPVMSSSIQAATTPKDQSASFVPRCADCVSERYCSTCHKWWCESCYELPNQRADIEPGVVIVTEGGSPLPVAGDESDDFFSAVHASAPKFKPRFSKSCWECGNSCPDCIARTQRVCRKCCGGYCTTHNEGSSAHFCDWCVSRGRGLGRL